jgi:acetyl esterase/lipase
MHNQDKMLTSLLLLFAAQPQIEPNVVYAKVAGVSLMMDIYRPVASKTTAAAVVVIHGGAWTSGKRSDMARLAQLVASKGMLAATVSYRLAPQFQWPAQLDDVQTSVRYLRANAAKYNIDPTRVGAAGASAGGHLALLLGMRDPRSPKGASFAKQSSRVAAVFDMFGPTDFALFPAEYDVAFPILFGKARKDAAAGIKDASPINFVDKRSAPIFIYQGLKDTLVDAKQSRNLEARYRALGLPVEVVYLSGIGHEFKESDPRCVDAVQKGVTFLARRLAPKSR